MQLRVLRFRVKQFRLVFSTPVSNRFRCSAASSLRCRSSFALPKKCFSVSSSFDCVFSMLQWLRACGVEHLRPCRRGFIGFELLLLCFLEVSWARACRPKLSVLRVLRALSAPSAPSAPSLPPEALNAPNAPNAPKHLTHF